MDSYTNFSYGTVTLAPAPPETGLTLETSATVAAPSQLVVWPTASQRPTAGNAEILRVTKNVAGLLTVERVSEGSKPRLILVGDQVMGAFTKRSAETRPVTVTGAYVVVPGDEWVLLKYAAPANVTIPKASTWHSPLRLVAIGAEVATIKAVSGEEIQGKASITVGPQGSGAEYTSAILVSDGANWWVGG